MRLYAVVWLHTLLVIVSCEPLKGSFTRQHLAQLKNQTRELFDHGWYSYMDHGFPADEVRPLTCAKHERVEDMMDTPRNDVLGNYSVTFLDTIATFAIFGDVELFESYIEMIRHISFNVDATVQVFETSIRALGSLLSAHLYAVDKFQLAQYDGFLLKMAHDLGMRLSRAYTETEHGLPLARVNLRHGIKGLPDELIKETCTAGAGSPMLEFTLLSILTNDTLFETISRDAYMALWNGRTGLNLLPTSLDPLNRKWLNAITGIGASIDSFYEYALKGAILFDDAELMSIWKKSYNALLAHSSMLWFMVNIHSETGMIVTPWLDSLSAFFPGLLVLAGKVKHGIKLHEPFMKLWGKYGGIPERWDFLASDSKGQVILAQDEMISLEWYPLRPEFVESTYYLYRATKDPVYLRIGEKILNDYSTVFKSRCGFAGFRDIRTGEMQDRMESFVLSETFMYLYLLFDEDNPLHGDDRMVFSTEGHPLWLPKGVYSEYRHHKELELQGVEFSIEAGNVSNESEKSWDEKVVGFFKCFFDDEDEGSIPLIDEDAGVKILEVEECPVSDLNGFYSNFLTRGDAFHIESKFQSQFTQMKNLEIDTGFYTVFSPPDAQCNREVETSILNFNFGEMVDVKDCELRYDSQNLTVTTLKGVLLRLELLKLGQVDSGNVLVDELFLEQHCMEVEYDIRGTCTPEDELFVNSVFRVLSVNGVELDAGGELKVLYAEREIEKSSSGLVKVVGNQLMVKGVLITNLVLVTVG